MKRFFLLGLMLCSVALYADDCSESLNEAKGLYNKGDYSKAKEMFEYVASECGTNYGNAASWARKCTEELTPQLTVSRTSISVGASSGTTSVTVTSNREWKLQSTTSNMFYVSKNGNIVTINYYANSTSSSRSDYFYIVTSDGSKSARVTITQSAATKSSSSSQSTQASSTTSTTSSSTYSGETTLSVSKSYIYATASGLTEYITVTSNRSWEIQYPSGGMYSAWRDGNKVVVNISTNTTNGSRSDFFNIRTTDGKKSIKITLSQGVGTSSSSSRSSSSYQTNSSRSYGRSTYSPSNYRQYMNSQGIFEITWYSMRLGIGSGAAYSISPMKLRLGPVQLSPAEIAVGWDFLRSDLHANYQPTIDALIPVNQYSAIYAGIGPTIDIGDNDIWFKIEAGWHYHWGSSASSDFFLRYDGTFCVGTSIQWSTGW